MLEICDLRLDTWDIDYISDNWEQQYEQLHCDHWIQSDGDSICNSCDVLARTNINTTANVTQSLAVFFFACNPFVLSVPTIVEAGVIKHWHQNVHLPHHLPFQVGFWLRLLPLLNPSSFYLAPSQLFQRQGSTDQYSTPGKNHSKPACRNPLSPLVSETKYLYAKRRFSSTSNKV